MPKKTTAKKSELRGTYFCVDCSCAGPAKRAKRFKDQQRDFPEKTDPVLILCPNCYRLRTNPSCDDILRAIIAVKEMVDVRHTKLWHDQIKADKSNCEERGTPATESIKLVDEILAKAVSGLLLHHSIVEKPKKTKKR